MEQVKFRNEYCTQSTLLKRGWTKSGITKFLGKPDKEAPNPHFKSAYPMKLFEVKRVKKLEKSEKWQKWYKKSLKRRKSAKKAVATKKQQSLNYAQNLHLEIEMLPMNEIIDNAVNQHNNWQWNRLSVQNGKREPYIIDKKSITTRQILNYIRHNLTDYDIVLEQIKGKVGVGDAYNRIKNNLMKQIVIVYPELNISPDNYDKMGKKLRIREYFK